MNGAHVTAALCSDRRVPCKQVLIASGAWAAALSAKLGVSLPMKSVRGQAVMFGPCSPLPISHTIYSTSGYLVPRPCELALAGATEEDAGFDAHPTDAGREAMQALASSLVPALATVPVVEAWAGLRPVMVDGLPAMGRAPGWENVFLACGHGRNGILLTPVTADMMREFIIHDIAPPTAFSPSRFGGTL